MIVFDLTNIIGFRQIIIAGNFFFYAFKYFQSYSVGSMQVSLLRLYGWYSLLTASFWSLFFLSLLFVRKYGLHDYNYLFIVRVFKSLCTVSYPNCSLFWSSLLRWSRNSFAVSWMWYFMFQSPPVKFFIVEHKMLCSIMCCIVMYCI